jgi:GT2 family glycosyltransferase
VSPLVVSVLIVNHQTYTELGACLGSLQNFLGGDLEVILVDHAREPLAAKSLLQEFPWIRLLEVDANPGFAAGVNRAASVASGKYLLLLNPDCVVQEDVARSLARWLDEHPAVGVCGALVREVDGSVQASARRFPGLSTAFAGRTSWLTRVWPANRWTRRNLLAPQQEANPIMADWVSGACMMVRRVAFDEVGGMDERFFLYWEDADLCRRLHLKGWSTVYNPGVGVTHLTGRSSARTRARSTIAFHRSAFRYFWKHAGLFTRLTAPIVYLGLQARLAFKLALLNVRRAWIWIQSPHTENPRHLE